MTTKTPKTKSQSSSCFRKMVTGSFPARILGLLFLAMLHSGMALADVGADLQLAPVPRRAVLKEAGYVVWGASMVQDDTGVCHLFYARWKGSLGDWCKGGEIVRNLETHQVWFKDGKPAVLFAAMRKGE